jgi:hypothetical protein
MSRRSPLLGGRFHTAIRSNPDGSVAETEPRDHLAAIDANTGLGGEFLQAKGETTVRFAQFAFVP